MFNSNELSILTLDYFNVKMCCSDVCELESQNGDHWIILKQQTHIPKRQLQNVKHFNYIFMLYHRHNDGEGFHLHAEHINVLDAILDIINHDDYRLKRKGKTYFDKVVSMFSGAQASS